MKKDEFGNRMKAYEHAGLKDSYDGRFPLYMRLDGRGFSKLTKKLKLNKPRDENFQSCFDFAILKTMKEFSFQFGFNQSDEVSLYFPILENPESELPFGGKTYKLLSVIPAYFSSTFTQELRSIFSYEDSIAFDARLVEFPSKEEAANMMIWRWQDARRNYISDMALTKFSAKQLNGISTKEREELIGGIDELKVMSYYGKMPFIIDDVGTLRDRYTQFTFNMKDYDFEDRMSVIYGR